MEELKKNKFLLYTFCATLVLFLGYFLFLRGGSSASSPDLSADASNSGAGSEILSSLAALSSAQIDTALFASPAWMSLRDISAGVPSEAAGKVNLFAPIGSQ